MPYELDPYTLETVGRYDYNGAVKSVWMSAHPHLDQTTNELLTFAYQAKGDGTTDVAYFVIGPDGKVKHEVWFNAPWAGMVHDFAISDKYVIFPFFPLLTDVDSAEEGRTVLHLASRPPDGRRRRSSLRQGGRGPLVPRAHELRRTHDERLDRRLESQPRRLPLARAARSSSSRITTARRLIPRAPFRISHG